MSLVPVSPSQLQDPAGDPPPPVPQCSVCGGLGCPMTDPVLFPASKSAASSSSAPSSSSSSSCGHVVCRGCYRHIASVATLTMLRECAPLCGTHNQGTPQSGETALAEPPSPQPPCQPGTSTTHKSSNNACEVQNGGCGSGGDCYCVSVKCPVLGCGATSARVRDVSMLIPDPSARDYLLQVMKDKEEEPEEGLCMFGSCMDENSVARKATLTCMRCKGMLFCESCFYIRHKAPGLNSHKGEPIPTSEVLTEEHKCPKHPKKDLDLFCLEEREPLCSLCAFSSAHSTHKCVPLDEIGPQIRESILSVTPKLEEVVALERDAIKKCEASILESEKTLQSIASNVETETDSILHSMKQKTSEVIADCTMISSLIESHAKEHKECLEVCMSTHQRAITRALEIAKSSDVVSLIAADKKLKETLCECTHLVSSGAMTPCLSARNITHHINIEALKEVLNNFAAVQYNKDPQPAEVQGSDGTPFSIKGLIERVVQLEKSLATEIVLNSELRAQLDANKKQLTELRAGMEPQVEPTELEPTKLEAKVVASSDHHNASTPENTLKEGTIGYASLVGFSGEVFIVYDLFSVRRLQTFQLRNRGTDRQIVKTFSLYGGNTATGPWTVTLDRAHANLSADVLEAGTA
ncbi:hypothetical protein Pelo_4806 [Pelomyxa schiedti]|nr:hypothetical protein Pelo_4806 [Pelomyxa schiedti]